MRKGKTRLYTIWHGMKDRCHNPKRYGYMYYGGKGIKVCDEWLSFEAFQAWALVSGYGDDLQIDRIDTEGHYEPGNCRWVTREENFANRRAGKPTGLRFTLNEIEFALRQAGVDPATVVPHLPNKRRYRDESNGAAHSELDGLRELRRAAYRNDPRCRVLQPDP